MHPIKYAAALALFYALIAGLYIVLSGRVAAAMASSVGELQQIEAYKGLVFVALTALMLFGLASLMFRRLKQQIQEAEAHQQAFIATEQAATMGLLTSTMAHDFNNLLMVLQGCHEELRALEFSDDAEALLQEMDVATQRGVALCANLSQASRGQHSHQLTSMDLSEMAQEVASLVKLHRRARACEVCLDLPDVLRVEGDVVMLHRMLVNLMINALDACRATVRLSIKSTARGIIVDVEDDGEGLDEALGEKIFEPFFTTKPQGTGLGLISVKTCATFHQGRVELGESSLGGARFRVILWEIEVEPAPMLPRLDLMLTFRGMA